MNAIDSIIRLANLPWVVIGCMLVPLAMIAWRSKSFPTIRMVLVAIPTVVLSFLVIFDASWIPALLALDALLVFAMAIDFCTLPKTSDKRGRLDALRTIPRVTSISAPTPCEVTLLNRTGKTYRGSLRDDLPDFFAATPADHKLFLPPLAKVTFRRSVTAQRRGAFAFTRLDLEVYSLLGLWRRMLTLPLASTVDVYPDMRQLAEYGLLARTDRLSLIGVRRTRRVGQDSDFERLRDYTPDDNYRHVDWRTTARRNKLTVRQFQSDQSQRIIFLLDCGRMMTNERKGLSLLDHSLNAALMLSYVALKQGDAVGMLCFADGIQAYIPPQGGKNQLNRLLQAGFNQFPQMVESRYDQAFLYLSNHCRRRSLVVLVTSVIDEVNAGQVVDYLGNLVGRHLPLGVLLRDRQMYSALDQANSGPQGLYRAAVAAEILGWRDQVIRDLRHRGSLVLDVFPEEMTAPLVNEYLRIKAGHLL